MLDHGENLVKNKKQNQFFIRRQPEKFFSRIIVYLLRLEDLLPKEIFFGF